VVVVPTVRIPADIVVQSANGASVALVEIKNRESLTPEIAATIRRNLLAHGFGSVQTPFFLMVSQDHGYLWDQRQVFAIEEEPPTVRFTMEPVVQRYLPSLADGIRLSGSQLELAVAQWLSDLTRDGDLPPSEPEATLRGTDFVEMIRGGEVQTLVGR
jgi:hypothetical protein